MIEQITHAVYSAMITDLPKIKLYRSNRENGKIVGDPVQTGQRDPRLDELEVVSFPQEWASTALGFSGIGGQSFTSAQTTIVRGIYTDVAAVYFGTRLAYLIDRPNETFFSDVRAQRMNACVGAKAKYQR